MDSSVLNIWLSYEGCALTGSVILPAFFLKPDSFLDQTALV